MCGRLAVSLAVSALATGIGIVNGDLDRTGSDGNEFFAMGVPPDWDGPVGASPERAVAEAARSGRRVDAVPRLVAPSPLEAYPQGALWLVSLDGPASLIRASDGRRLTRDRLYIGLGSLVGRRAHARAPPMAVAADSQPPDVTVSYLRYPTAAAGSGASLPVQVLVRARRRPDVPVRFESVTIAETE